MINTNKIACIGAGYWGKNLVRNFNEIGVLSWICDADPHRRAQLAMEYPDARLTDAVDQVLTDPNVTGIAIATPAVTHADLVQRALLAGKDVFVEKPLSLSVEEAQRLVAVASDRRRILMVGHLLWYHPAVLKLKQLVDEGELGRIRYIYSNRLNLGKIRREENILWSFAPHDISVILGVNRSPLRGVASHHGCDISRPTYHCVHLWTESGSTTFGAPSAWIAGIEIGTRPRL